MASWDTGTDFKSLLETDPTLRKHITPEELDKLFDINMHLKDVDRTFRALGL